VERVLGESQPDVKSPPCSSVHPCRSPIVFVRGTGAIEFRGGPRTKSAGLTSNPLKHRSAHRRGRHQGRDLNGLIGRGRCSQWRRLKRRHSIGSQPFASSSDGSRCKPGFRARRRLLCSTDRALRRFAIVVLRWVAPVETGYLWRLICRCPKLSAGPPEPHGWPLTEAPLRNIMIL
jgi:hypothetical protein